MRIPQRAIGTLQITSAEIQDGSITSSDIGTGAVGNSNLAANAVDAGKIAANAVDTTKITSAAQAALKGVDKELNWVSLAVSADNTQASSSTLPETPLVGSLTIFVNGVPQTIGDGVKTTDCFFSSTAAGTTARTLATIQSGDYLIFNAGIAAMPLLAGDPIKLRYRV